MTRLFILDAMVPVTGYAPVLFGYRPNFLLLKYTGMVYCLWDLTLISKYTRGLVSNPAALATRSLRAAFTIGPFGWSRTNDALIKSQVLWPLSYEGLL